MNEVVTLASLKWVELRNRGRRFVSQSRFKILVIAAFSALFWYALYFIFYLGISRLDRKAGVIDFEGLVERMFYIFFFALTLMLVFSNAIIGYSSYFKSKETGFLLTSPVRPESIFLYKFFESLGFSSWAVIFLGTPLMAAYGRHVGVEWHFYLTSTLILVAYMMIPAAIGGIVVMLVTVYIPRTRRTLVVGTILAVALIVIIGVVKLLVVRGGSAVEVKLASEIFDYTDFSKKPLLPSYWLSEGMLSLANGRYSSAGFFSLLILSNVFFLVCVTYVVSGHLMIKGWFVSQGLRNRSRYSEKGWVDRVFSGLLFFVDQNVRYIVIKDVKSFLRDPVQWSQFLIFFGLLGIYFLNLRAFAYEKQDMIWKNLIAQMNLLATSLTLATFASRFIFPQLSLEGRRFWVIGMAPMEREKILFGKLALSFSCSLIISEVLIALSSWMLEIPLTLSILHAVSLFGICLGLSGLAVGLGAIYPNFAEDNPSKIVSGFGGTLNLVMSLIFVLVVLAAQAVPCFYYYGRNYLSGPEFRWVIVGSMLGIAALSLVACLVPLSMGLRSIKRLEI